MFWHYKTMMGLKITPRVLNLALTQLQYRGPHPQMLTLRRDGVKYIHLTRRSVNLTLQLV